MQQKTMVTSATMTLSSIRVTFRVSIAASISSERS
jgi:hypothetical protein